MPTRSSGERQVKRGLLRKGNMIQFRPELSEFEKIGS